MALAYYDDEQPQSSIMGSIKAGLSKFSGLIFLSLAVATFFMLATHSVNDPSFFNETNNPAQNAFGVLGANISAILLQTIGYGAYLIPVALTFWAGRALLGFQTDHVIGRLVFLIPALLTAASWAATHSVTQGWFLASQNIGLGGGAGDAILGGFISILPFGAHFGLFLASIFFFVIASLSAGYVCGFQAHEVSAIWIKLKRDFFIFLLGCALVVQKLITAVSGQKKPVTQNLAPVAPQPVHSEAKINVSMPERDVQKPVRASSPATRPQVSKFGSQRGILGSLLDGFASKKAVNKPVRTSAQPAPMMQAEPQVDLSNLTLSQRIKALADQNAEAHNTLLKRRLHDDPNAVIDDTDIDMNGHVEFEGDETIWQGADPMDAIYQDAQVVPAYEPIAEPAPLVQPAKVMAPKPSQKSARDAQPSFAFEAQEKQFEMPSLSMLANPDNITRHVPPREALEASAKQLEAVLEDYGVKGEIVAVRPGPVVTMYELEPSAGLKASRVIGLADDIARSMAAVTARVSTIPGRSVIGIELPNEVREMVLLREIFTAKDYGDSRFPLPLALGKDISGEPIVANLAKMPHLLIAGTTGSGKSVAINTMILSLLYHAKPEDVRMIMIDPKMLELSVYDDIPHLLSPVVTDPKKAVVALKWTVGEMEERYRKMSKMGVRNIDGYNARVQAALDKGEAFTRTVQTGFDDITGEPIFETEEYAPEKMPYIVVVVDEMADLMMVSGKEIEACIQRLAQMARASGIHLIMATQRPSVDVITGTIKANFPTRISFQVTSKIDSRTILGEMGAEQLLGQGDMLYMAGGGRVTRVHGPFVSDNEVEEIVTHLKAQGEPVYVSGVIEGPEEDKGSDIDAVLGLSSGSGGEDELYDQAVMIVARDRKCSTSYIQRKLSIGYNKAATLVERLEDEGVVSAANHVGKREILVPEMN